MEIRSVFDADKLDALLVANWTHFLDSSRLMSFIVQAVQANTHRLAVISAAEIKPKGMRITLSRCHWTSAGFILWVEFHLPLAADKMAEGTTELKLSYDGSLQHIMTTGNIFCKN
jgi:hypothetical protein